MAQVFSDLLLVLSPRLEASGQKVPTRSSSSPEGEPLVGVDVIGVYGLAAHSGRGPLKLMSLAIRSASSLRMSSMDKFHL